MFDVFVREVGRVGVEGSKKKECIEASDASFDEDIRMAFSYVKRAGIDPGILQVTDTMVSEESNIQFGQDKESGGKVAEITMGEGGSAHLMKFKIAMQVA